MHFIDFAELDDHIHLMSWNESEPKLIVSDGIYEISRVTLGSRMPTPFRLVPEEVWTPYVDDVHIPDIQYIIYGGRGERQQPPTTARPLEGTSSHEKVLRILTSFNLLLGRPWIHRAGVIPSSLHQKYGSIVVLDMMRSMSYLPGMGLGRHQHEPSEFMAIPDHDVPSNSSSSPLRPITDI
ncbi:hypothetical protein AAG906_004318 [Vitis piasezkii]